MKKFILSIVGIMALAISVTALLPHTMINTAIKPALLTPQNPVTALLQRTTTNTATKQGHLLHQPMAMVPLQRTMANTAVLSEQVALTDKKRTL